VEVGLSGSPLGRRRRGQAQQQGGSACKMAQLVHQGKVWFIESVWGKVAKCLLNGTRQNATSSANKEMWIRELVSFFAGKTFFLLPLRRATILIDRLPDRLVQNEAV
jgi:hypothetical protein